MTVKSGRLVYLYALLLGGTVLAWLWAFALFGSSGILLGTAAIAYVLGLRHAMDADHIAAIDNVTRKLIQQGQEPVTVGFYFSLGHSTVVALACALIATATARFRPDLALLHSLGETIGTVASVTFLLVIALANTVTLASVWRSLRTGTHETTREAGGLMSGLLRPLVAVISSPRQMYPLGLLFGLGFDTASEVGLLSLSAGAVSQTAHAWTIMVFPALFTAGMALVDTTEGLLMKGAYGWATAFPQRKLAYNFAITLFSILVALAVGGLETLGLIGNRLELSGGFWRVVDTLNANFGVIGCAITLAVAACWMTSQLMFRAVPASHASE